MKWDQKAKAIWMEIEKSPERVTISSIRKVYDYSRSIIKNRLDKMIAAGLIVSERETKADGTWRWIYCKKGAIQKRQDPIPAKQNELIVKSDWDQIKKQTMTGAFMKRMKMLAGLENGGFFRCVKCSGRADDVIETWEGWKLIAMGCCKKCQPQEMDMYE